MSGKIKHLEGRYRLISYRLMHLCDDAELRLYVFLKLHAIAKHDCFPSASTILGELKWSRAKLFRTLARMKSLGRLTVDGGSFKGLSNVYDITWYDLENEKGFIHSQSRNQTATSIETRLPPVSKRDYNNKERNNKERTTTSDRGDKSPHRRSGRTGGMQSMSDILKGRKPPSV